MLVAKLNNRNTGGLMYIQVNLNTMLASNLKTQEVIILSIVHSFTKKGLCFVGNKYFSELLGVTTVHVSRIINGLIRQGYLRSVFTPKKQRLLDVTAKATKLLNAKNGGSIVDDEPVSVAPETYSITRLKDREKAKQEGLKSLRGILNNIQVTH